MTDESSAVSTVVDLRNRVQVLIGSSTPDIVEQIVQTFVKQERDRRVELLVSALKKHAEAEAAFLKLKPDHIIFNEDGVTIKEKGWTAPKKSERDKAQKIVDKFANALNGAISKGDFKLLEDVVKGGGDQKQGQTDDVS
jgi:hypothetical protein